MTQDIFCPDKIALNCAQSSPISDIPNYLSIKIKIFSSLKIEIWDKIEEMLFEQDINFCKDRFNWQIFPNKSKAIVQNSKSKFQNSQIAKVQSAHPASTNLTSHRRFHLHALFTAMKQVQVNFNQKANFFAVLEWTFSVLDSKCGLGAGHPPPSCVN